MLLQDINGVYKGSTVWCFENRISQREYTQMLCIILQTRLHFAYILSTMITIFDFWTSEEKNKKTRKEKKQYIKSIRNKNTTFSHPTPHSLPLYGYQFPFMYISKHIHFFIHTPICIHTYLNKSTQYSQQMHQWGS